MHRSTIEWVLNPDNKTLGWVWNVITGCVNHINGMCKGGNFPCYAYQLANGRLKGRYLANHWIPDSLRGTDTDVLEALLDPFYPRFWPERLEEIKPSGAWWDTLGGRQAKGRFTCDMSDMFGIGVPEDWTREIMEVIKSDPLDRFYLLTKQSQNLAAWNPFPENAWVGITATGIKAYKQALTGLAITQARIKYLSFEPLLERIPMSPPYSLDKFEIQWVIIGQCTPVKNSTKPSIESVREIVEACDKANIPCFLKYNLVGHIPVEEPFYQNDGTGWKIRQEMPTG